FEPILGPIWVWLVHSEVPSVRTIVGGAVVVTALLVHIGLEFKRQPRPQRPGVTGLPSPN
ncbi:MAG: EamA family transporter, partial [Mesorhizobium sp.]